MSEVREKFATQVNPTLLAEVINLAKTERRQIEALVDEALTDLLEKHKKTQPRSHVMAAYQESHNRYAGLYEKLAK